MKIFQKFPVKIDFKKKLSSRAGRENYATTIRNFYTKILAAISLLVLALPALLFADYITTTSAFLTDKETRLAQYVVDNDVEVGKTVVDNDYEQIYFVFEDETQIITNSRTTKGEPQTHNEYITWMEEIDGSWQIFLYHIPTQNTLQLSRSGNNVNPKVHNGKVVWEGWVDEAWQVFLYDGKSIRQISQGTLSESPDIENDFVVFTQKFDQGWKTFAYSVKANSLKELSTGFEEGGYIELRNGDIFFGTDEFTKSKHPQMINEIFLLELPFDTQPGQPQEVSQENMREYLEKLIEDAETLQRSENNATPTQNLEDIEGLIEEIETSDTATSSGEVESAEESTSSGELN